MTHCVCHGRVSCRYRFGKETPGIFVLRAPRHPHVAPVLAAAYVGRVQRRNLFIPAPRAAREGRNLPYIEEKDAEVEAPHSRALYVIRLRSKPRSASGPRRLDAPSLSPPIPFPTTSAVCCP